MSRPWHYWMCFVAACLVVLPAMGWLTFKAMELDRARALARRQADLEQSIGRALWRMDVKLMPHLAREAARPAVFYSCLLPSGKRSIPSAAQLSPLLTDRSEFVLVNYQVEPGDIWSSPQAPSASVYDLACESGASPQEISMCTAALSTLQALVSYDQIAAMLPAEPLSARDRFGNPTLFRNSIVDLQRPITRQGSAQLQEPVQQRASVPARPSSSASDNNDYVNRDAAMQSYTQQAATQQVPTDRSLRAEGLTEGVSHAIWIDDRLLLARRVDVGGKRVFQGCWLDWDEIRAALVDEVRDVLPDATLAPVTGASQAPIGRMLATLPVQLVAALPDADASNWSAMQVALLVAWTSVLVAAIAAAMLLHGVLTLSERRGAFVSAVTHELRTPLTTFRMYSEMLAADMVDESKRQSYLDTLRAEADRLAHLVENVLSYARLERAPQRHNREALSIGTLLDRVGGRLADRARQAEMQLVISAAPEARQATVTTDPAAVEQILFNLVDNACKYAARSQDRRIHLGVECGESVVMQVRDHGFGISVRQSKLLFRPFSKSADDAAHSAPGVGLGLALCRRLAHDLGGRLEWLPNRDAGAAFQLTLPR